MDCKHCQELLPQYIRGTLPDETARELEAHAATCDACALELEELQWLHQGVSAEGFGEHVPARLLYHYAADPVSLEGHATGYVRGHLSSCQSCQDELTAIEAELAEVDPVSERARDTRASPGWLDALAATGIRAVLAPGFRDGRWYTEDGHSLDYAWDLPQGARAMQHAFSLIERAAQHPSATRASTPVIAAMPGLRRVHFCRRATTPGGRAWIGSWFRSRSRSSVNAFAVA